MRPEFGTLKLPFKDFILSGSDIRSPHTIPPETHNGQLEAVVLRDLVKAFRGFKKTDSESELSASDLGVTRVYYTHRPLFIVAPKNIIEKVKIDKISNPSALFIGTDYDLCKGDGISVKYSWKPGFESEGAEQIRGGMKITEISNFRETKNDLLTVVLWDGGLLQSHERTLIHNPIEWTAVFIGVGGIMGGRGELARGAVSLKLK
jgi:hypothetical protein